MCRCLLLALHTEGTPSTGAHDARAQGQSLSSLCDDHDHVLPLRLRAGFDSCAGLRVSYVHGRLLSFQIESVDLALKILDNYDVRGHKIKVQRAEFQMRGEYNPTLKPKMRKKEKERLKKMQES